MPLLLITANRDYSSWSRAALVLLVGSVAIVMLAALAWRFVFPPRLLTFADGIAGGGSGTSRPGSGVPFGTHGQRLDVWRPAGPVERRPVVIFFYGGGWVAGDRHAYGFAARAFARSGFVTVVPDYRKVPEVHFPAFLQDAAEAVKWTRDHIADYGGDPTRIALVGHSAGAYAVAMLALDQSWLRAEGVDPHIVRAAVGLSGPYDFYPWTSDQARAALGNAADPHQTQPITFARADAPPMLLVTSDKDGTVRPRNAIRLADRLHALGARATLIEYRGLDHAGTVMALSKIYRSRAPVLADSVAFLGAHLR